MITSFPPVEKARADGLIGVGGDLEVGSLLLAYQSGIFPWPVSKEYPLLWFSPPKRAVLEFGDLHIPTRLQRSLKKKNFVFKVDTNFEKVISHCAEGKNRKQKETWILDDMILAYCAFHKAGFAHSFETYNADGELVGGMYGVWIKNYFAGESMFYLEPDASKFALIRALTYLKEKGVTWLDAQVMSPLLKMLGAKDISRKKFLEKLSLALVR